MKLLFFMEDLIFSSMKLKQMNFTEVAGRIFYNIDNNNQQRYIVTNLHVFRI